MAYLAAAIIIVGCVGGCVLLVLNGHPWFGILVLLMTSGVSIEGGK